MRKSLLLNVSLAFAASLCACGDEGFLPIVDAGPGTDARPRQTDAGPLSPPQTDAGPPLVDAGPEQRDAGEDAGEDACVSETDLELCNEAELECGPLETIDGCEAPRSVVCGTCPGTSTCGGGGVPGRCGCVTEETDADLCADMDVTCGTRPLTDACGQTRSVDCGTCSGDDWCGGGGTPGACGCTPESDAALCRAADAECGSLSVVDRCGAPREITCGDGCDSPLSCGGGGTANRCGCALESDDELCAEAGVECGETSVTDRCGTRRSISCGGCRGADTCGGGGVAGECGCTPETDAVLCAAASATCGQPQVRDSCGDARSPSCGDCSGTLVCDATFECVSYSEPFDRICSDAGWCWENPQPQGNTLEDAATIGPNDVWVVGGAGTVLRWNGTRWSGWAGAANADLHAVWARQSNDVWIVGDDGVVLRWNGTALRTVDARTTENLSAVWGSGPRDVWVGGPNVLRRWDGTVWTDFTIDTSVVSDLYGFAANDVWAIGSGGSVHHFDGATWSRSATVRGSLSAIWGAGPTDIWAVGSQVYHFNGATWTTASLPLGANAARGVWGTSASDVWVAGVYDANGWDMGSWIYHFDGLTWSEERVDLPYPSSFYAIGGSSSSPVAVGQDGTMARRVNGVWNSLQTGVIRRSMHLNRDRWEDTTPQGMSVWVPPGVGAPVIGARRHYTTWSSIRHLYGGLLVPHAQGWVYEDQDVDDVGGTIAAGGLNLWMIDPRGRVRQGIAGAYPQVLEIGGSTRRGGAIWAVGDNDVWAVNEAQTQRWDGLSWTNVSNPVSGTSSRLRALWASGPSAVWAVGEDAVVLRYDGRAWTAEVSGAPTTVDFVAVDGRSPSDVWAGGGYQQLSHWNGMRWSIVDAPTRARALHVDDSGAVWMIGSDGALHRRSSGVWALEPAPISAELYAVDGRRGQVWAAGDNMAVLSYTR